MRKILVNKKDVLYEVLIDDEDFERVSKHGWCISFGNSLTYCRVEARINRKTTRLHRFILNVTDAKISVDHIDGNPLNNQKSNLRLCNHQQNMMNIHNTKPNKHGFCGVYQNHGNGKFRACFSHKNKTFHVPGNFDTAEEAAMARDEYVKIYRKEFAVLNFKRAERG